MDSNEKRISDEIKRLLKQLEALIYNSCLAAMNLFQVKKSLSGNTPFWFSQNATADRQMNKLISTFNKQANALFLKGIERSWKIGEENAIDRIRLAFSGSARQQKAFDRIRTEASQEQRNQGSRASAKRYAEGINLSGRVWKLGAGIKQEIETVIQNGMKEGKSADQLSRELNKYLNEPDKLFRKVRNKDTGELELSEAAKKYRPGQGIYRSAKKNAMRLARTEIAAAYRRAAWESFQNDPRIIGIRISLSNNHTCINPRTGKPEPFHDICDRLAGNYPKSFLWTGWHPQCRCVINPIAVSGDEATKFIDAKVNGETYEPKQIAEPPAQFKKWVTENKDRIEKAEKRGTLPYFLKDNANFAGIKVSSKNFMDGIEIRRIETNKAEYERMKKDPDYIHVRLNENTGGLLAIHKDHSFDSTVGKFGIPRGDYERISAEVLYRYGRSVVLVSENMPDGIKTPEGLLDGVKFDIKGIEGTGKRNIIDKISLASRQNAEAIVLYYHDKNIFDEQRIVNAFHGYLKLSKNRSIKTVYYIVNGKLHKITA
jgi:hypothetical protein